MAYTPKKGLTNNKWNKANYERLDLMVPKGMNEEIKKAADELGYPSKRMFCIDAIKEKIESAKLE